MPSIHVQSNSSLQRLALIAPLVVLALSASGCGEVSERAKGGLAGNPDTASQDFFDPLAGAELEAQMASVPQLAAVKPQLDAGDAQVVRIRTYLFGRDHILFNFPADDPLTLRRISRQDHSSRRYTWTGRSVDGTASATFDVEGDAVRGRIESGGRTHTVEPLAEPLAEGLHLLQRSAG